MRMLLWTFLPTQPGAGSGAIHLPALSPPRKSALWLTFSGFSFPGLPSCAVAAIALSGEVAKLPGLPSPASESYGTSV